MAPAGAESSVLRSTTDLIDFLAEVTAAARQRTVHDITATGSNAPRPLLWLADLPEGIEVERDDANGVLLRVDPVPVSAPPKPGPELAEWLDEDRIRSAEGPEPELVTHGGDSAGALSEPDSEIHRAHEEYLERWRRWAVRERRANQRRQLYYQLERVAKAMEQQDDEYEFVLATGLVTWRSPEGRVLRRHLLTESVLPSLDRDTARITVTTTSSARRRLEGNELFEGLPSYSGDRGRARKERLVSDDFDLLSERAHEELTEWLGIVVQAEFDVSDSWHRPDGDPPETLSLRTAPALLLRPRSQEKEAEAYQEIAAALRASDVEIPVGLSQLVVDTEPQQRDRWLEEQGAARGDVLGSDPLFPLAANDEQTRVLELLRSETGVVVQGPPGTGKTHTIANLVSALLARGQRVLVTSQKDQALRVLREHIPADLRRLCVLLAGGSKDASVELQRGLDALSDAIATTDTATLAREGEQLRAERDTLLTESARLNREIREMRSVESTSFDPVAPDYSTDLYSGPLTRIVCHVQDRAEPYRWIPPVPEHQPDRPPLGVREFGELHRLIQQDSPERRARADQQLPNADQLPGSAGLTKLVHTEREARQAAEEVTSARTRELAALSLDQLRGFDALLDEARAALHQFGVDASGERTAAPEWAMTALHDRFAGRRTGLWDQLVGIEDEANRLQQALQAEGVSHHVDVEPITSSNLGKARGWLTAGRALLEHFNKGGKLRRFLPPKQVQKDAEPLFRAVQVDGAKPDTAAKLTAALDRLEAEAAVVQLADKWTDADVEVPTGRVGPTLSALHDNATVLKRVGVLANVQQRLATTLTGLKVHVDLSTPRAFASALQEIPAAQRHVEAEEARRSVDALYARFSSWAADEQSCPELADLLLAVSDRDVERYSRVLADLDAARAQQNEEHRHAQLCRTLGGVHPALLDRLRRTADDPAWEQRSSELADAWAWSKAQQFVAAQRNADAERRLSDEFGKVADRIKKLTEQLAAKYAMHSCVERMTDEHVRALRTYQQHAGRVGAGTGRKTRQFRKSAKDAMDKAKPAVPAWVVPLPNLLETLSAERDSFDVVIIDEASQVGLEKLYLLWMAPRVIVVGDDKQCTPQEGRLGKQDDLWEKLAEHLPNLDHDIRSIFTGKSSLYDVLSARSGKEAVVRLREHFRCMPEIIQWSSGEFYPNDSGKPGLIPLRRPEPDRLDPVRVTSVEGAYTEGSSERRRNPVEAKRIVETLVECLDDPDYAGKTFGIVVLQGTQQVKLLEHEINANVSPEVRQERKIRVGNAANFQGDERHIVFLSMVVADRPKASTATSYQQAYNVAASRARDQMWLFTSVSQELLQPSDLRSKLLGYMQEPAPEYGGSPALDSVPVDELCEPFDSLFEQQVFREIKQFGYHVVPQYEVGSRALDLVVVGNRGRLAVECDGHYWHTGPKQQDNDGRRDRELHRMGWETVRIRESEYYFDPQRELARLWERLDESGIAPVDAAGTSEHSAVPVNSEISGRDQEER